MEPLEAILARIEEFQWQSALYVQSDVKLAPAVWAQVVKRDPYSGQPLEAVPNRLKELLSIQDVQGIVSNARQQLARANASQLVAALEYYVQHDAFIDFSRSRTSKPTRS